MNHFDGGGEGIFTLPVDPTSSTDEAGPIQSFREGPLIKFISIRPDLDSPYKSLEPGFLRSCFGLDPSKLLKLKIIVLFAWDFNYYQYTQIIYN